MDVTSEDDGASVMRKVMRAVRSVRGTHQGCVLATLGACLPYHLRLHAFCKEPENAGVRVVMDADDTYLGGPPAALYPAFTRMQQDVLEHCDLRSNASKIKALAPRGGTDGIPPEILAAQEGEVYGIKCVGAFVAAERRRTASSTCGTSWRR